MDLLDRIVLLAFAACGFALALILAEIALEAWRFRRWRKNRKS